MRILLKGAAGFLLIAAACSRQTTPPPATPTPQPTRETAPPARPAENPDTPPGGGGGGGGGGRGGRGGQGGQQAQAEPTPQPYARVVTSEAVTRAGLFKTHRIGSRLLFEIPKNQLGKDQLVVLEI